MPDAWWALTERGGHVSWAVGCKSRRREGVRGVGSEGMPGGCRLLALSSAPENSSVSPPASIMPRPTFHTPRYSERTVAAIAALITASSYSGQKEREEQVGGWVCPRRWV